MKQATLYGVGYGNFYGVECDKETYLMIPDEIYHSPSIYPLLKELFEKNVIQYITDGEGSVSKEQEKSIEEQFNAIYDVSDVSIPEFNHSWTWFTEVPNKITLTVYFSHEGDIRGEAVPIKIKSRKPCDVKDFIVFDVEASLKEGKLDSLKKLIVFSKNEPVGSFPQAQKKNK